MTENYDLELIGLSRKISEEMFLATTKALLSANSVDEIRICFGKHFKIKSSSYHHIPAIGAYKYEQMNRYYSVNVPEELKRFYNKSSVGTDPGIRFVFEKARPMWLSDMPHVESIKGTAHEKQVWDALELVGDAILMPLFGPQHRRGYAVICFENSKSFYEEVFIWQIQALITNLHIRYSTVVQTFSSLNRLTPRETEVLELMTFGKTNPQIGTILGISSNTVAGYVKQIFLKLQTHDRVTAALRASSFTLVPSPDQRG